KCCCIYLLNLSLYKFYFIGNTVSIVDYANYLKDPFFYIALLSTVFVDFVLLYIVTKNEENF
ncbi:hypothetical protein, partial [Myroides pelagicus]